MKKAEVDYDFRSCPVPESNQRHVDFQSTALPTELTGHKTKSSGDRIWTYDLRVMSPTSFQTAPPRDIKLKWMGKDSNLRRHCQQIYSLSPLATRESTHIKYKIWKADDRTRTDNLLITNQLLCQLSHIGIFNSPYISSNDPDRTRTDGLRRDRAAL